ncbi:GNAT family N-acetyltransferase [Plantactinospora sonchi]|uniref:GNAT family N-acetyltransferase n=1 Tax=Plantactinospora sonchi TaxID=1544735 RepID=A0ABU7RY70_9ACTN
MPLLVTPALPGDLLATLAQPHLDTGDGLLLRPWRPEDAGTVRAAFSCPVIQRWHVRRIDGDAEARDWIAGWAARWRNGTDASWAVVDERDRPLGQVGLRMISLFEASAELSYWVLPAARGAGVAARSVGALTAWCFGSLGLHRLGLLHSTANAASCRVAERSGYALEGTLRSALRHADGWHDVHLHARLRADGDIPAASAG